MVMTATLLFLAVLTLLLFVGGASYLSRGAIRRGALIMTCAAGLSAVTSLVIYPALRLTHGGSDDSFRTAELEQLKADRDQLLTEVSQKSRDNEALAKTSAFFSKLHKERLTRISEEISGIKDLILGPQSGLILASDAQDTAVPAFLDGPNGFDSILADLRRLKGIKVRAPGEAAVPAATLAVLSQPRTGDAGTSGTIIDAPAASSAVADDSEPVKEADTLSSLHRALDLKMSTNSYKIEPIAEPEYVDGKKGRYYLVELKNQKNGDRFTFDSGKYTFQSSRAAYKASFNAFAADVLKQLEASPSKYELFVRGSADAQSYSGTLEPGFDFHKISYLPSSRGRYLANLATTAVPAQVKNTDLPNLRGEYLRGYLSELYAPAKATLLEGAVTKKGNPAARNTELILFVAW